MKKMEKKSFKEWLEDNCFMQHAYKARHKEKYQRNDWDDYIIEEWEYKEQDRITLYFRGMKGHSVAGILEDKGRVQLSNGGTDIVLQCKKCFEFDGVYEFYKYNYKELGESIAQNVETTGATK